MICSGIDMIEIERIEQGITRFGRRFLDRFYTERELSDAGESTASLAARFAAKEAVAKVLQTGIGSVGWKDIEIVRKSNDPPQLILRGRAHQRAADLGLDQWSVSLTHTKVYAIAMVVALRSTAFTTSREME